jgi:hypothetical protein
MQNPEPSSEMNRLIRQRFGRGEQESVEAHLYAGPLHLAEASYVYRTGAGLKSSRERLLCMMLDMSFREDPFSEGN